MTYGEANGMITALLRGDNSNPEILPLHYRMALMETATLCEPSAMIATYTGNETDVFRMLHPDIEDGEVVDKYIKTPVVSDPIDAQQTIPIDTQLDLAVIYFVCSMLSYKYRDAYEKKAEKIIKIYTSNELAK